MRGIWLLDLGSWRFLCVDISTHPIYGGQFGPANPCPPFHFGDPLCLFIGLQAPYDDIWLAYVIHHLGYGSASTTSCSCNGVFQFL